MFTVSVAAASKDRAPSFVIGGDFLDHGSSKSIFTANNGSVAGSGKLVDCKPISGAGVAGTPAVGGATATPPAPGGALTNNCG